MIDIASAKEGNGENSKKMSLKFARFAAGFFDFFVAFVVGTLILQIVIVNSIPLVKTYLEYLYEKGTPIGSSDFVTWAQIYSILIIVFLYNFLSEMIFKGRTLGKFIFGIKVVMVNSKPLTLIASLIRNIFRMVYLLILTDNPIILIIMFVAGAIFIIVNPKVNSIGDYAARTQVVDEEISTKKSMSGFSKFRLHIISRGISIVVLGILGGLFLLAVYTEQMFDQANEIANINPVSIKRMKVESLQWGQLAPLPDSIQNFKIKQSGSSFTTTYDSSFWIPKKDLKKWMDASPGFKKAEFEGANNEKTEELKKFYPNMKIENPAPDIENQEMYEKVYYLKAQPGRYVRVYINFTKGLVHIKAVWS